MTPQEMAEVRPRLLDFAAEMLDGLARKDQRAAGELYVRGLLTDGQRKSMQPMAARLGVDHQRLQELIASSTWDCVAVRRNIARWFAGGQPVEALVVDDTGFPKDGTASPCVARQYSGTLGKVANCQVAVSVHLAGEHASCAADWRLFCPESWDDAALDDPGAAAPAPPPRQQGPIPDPGRATEKGRPGPGGNEGVSRAGGGGGVGGITPPRPGPPRHRGPPRAPDAALPESWLLAEWPPEADEPADYWLSTLPEDTPIAEIVRLAKIRWRVEHDYRELKAGLGLDHFEGRSFAGWHRHATLAVLAQAFCTLLRADPKAPAPGSPPTPPSTTSTSSPPSSSHPTPA